MTNDVDFFGIGLALDSESRTRIVYSQANRLEDMFAKGTCAVR